MFDLSKTCPKCGEIYMGTHICSAQWKNDYDKGYEDGHRSVLPPPNLKTCYKCGETYTGFHICPDFLKSDYDRGYEAGKRAARREMGYAGSNGFNVVGE
jgi:ribosomal protein L32